MIKVKGYQEIIGLEVHIELKTNSKMFCGCSAKHFQVKPNTHTCPVCLGLPGALPTPNSKAIDWCLFAGLALNCSIPLFSKFDRKNYFYPDLPKGYQISQYDLPFCQNGWQKIEGKKIKIRRVHLEEDTAKLIHKDGFTLIDFNRSGVPLMEIVTEPDIKSPSQAKEYLKKLQQIIRYLEISDCDMEKGSMRLEANISLKKDGNQELPDYKVEIKNLNSFKFVEKALNYEITRQKEILESGQKLTPETRGWNEKKQITFSQRSKETEADYRYFPEPDLPPLKWQKEKIKKLKNSLPELPDQKIKKYVNQFKINEHDANLLIRQKQTALYFEKVVKDENCDPSQIAKLIVNKKVNIQKTPPHQLISDLKSKKKAVISDTNKLVKIIQEVIQENQKAVADLQKGKQAAMGFLLGQVMKKTKGKADPQIARKILEEKLNESAKLYKPRTKSER